MSTQPYVSEFLACIRHPVHEAGQESTFHVVITQWLPDITGTHKPYPYGPVTPQRAVELGFDMPKIIGEALAAAVLDRDSAIARADKAEEERDAAKEAAAKTIKIAQDEIAALRKAAQVDEKAPADAVK
jgi:hypothetical protein